LYTGNIDFINPLNKLNYSSHFSPLVKIEIKILSFSF
jgi:hypothetical protein